MRFWPGALGSGTLSGLLSAFGKGWSTMKIEDGQRLVRALQEGKSITKPR